MVDTMDKFRAMADHVKNNDIVAFDTETTSLNPRKGKIIGFSVTPEIGYGYYVPTMVFKDGNLQDTYIDGKLTHDLAKKFMTALTTKKLVMHNGSFDCRFVKCFYDVDLIPSLYADTILLVHTLMEEGAGFGSKSPFALKEIAKTIQNEIGLDVEKEANEEQVELKNSIKNNGGSITKENYEIFKADIEILSKYAAADTDLTLRVFNYFEPQLESQGLRKFYYEDEVMPLYREVTIPMESRGVRLDMPLITEAKKRISEDLKKYQELVIKELLSHIEVRTWVIYKATEAYPPNHKGAYAQELVSMYNIDIPKSEKTGKYSITNANVSQLPDNEIKEFLVTGNAESLPEDVRLKVSMKLWKEDNAGQYFNIQSKDHLGEIAFGALGIQPISETKTGKPQFDEDMIQIIAEDHDWAKNLRIYNKLMKISSTYMDRFLESHEDGKYYFSYKQHGTVSGRYGSDAQQLPRPKEEGEDEQVIVEYNNLVRAFFIPYDGNIFIDNDYESLEPKTFSHVSGDEGLMDIFRNNWDFYSTIAIKTEKLNQYSPDKKAPNYLRKLAPQLRNKAKAYSLGIPYGMGAYALGKNIGVKTKEAEELVDGYLNGFPNLKKWMEESKAFAKENGFIKTQVGRIRHLPKVQVLFSKYGDKLFDYKFKLQLEKQKGKEYVTNMFRDYKNGLNNSLNVQIQGLAASIVNRAAIAINREFKKLGISGQVVAQIHDQLIMEVEESRSKEAAEVVQDMMENTTKLKIPLVAIPSIAHNWRDGH
jgi:DNA polymerase I-like protein with 3'-5' exonuclease and polymerase domains